MLGVPSRQGKVRLTGAIEGRGRVGVRLSILANLDSFLSALLRGSAWRGVQGYWLPEFCIT